MNNIDTITGPRYKFHARIKPASWKIYSWQILFVLMCAGVFLFTIRNDKVMPQCTQWETDAYDKQVCVAYE